MPFGSEILFSFVAKLDAVKELQSQVVRLQAANDELQKQVSCYRDAMLSNTNFLADIGQELRSPLSGVIGMNELLMHTELTTEQRELAKASMESAQAILTLISDLQDLARVDSGHPAPEIVPTDVSEVIREACAACAESARRKHLFLNIDADPAIPSIVLANRSGLKHCLSNLLRNAVMTTDKGGIVLRVTKVDEKTDKVTLKFAVKDTGYGLTEEENLFPRTLTGTGLGLYLCKRTVDTMGGALTVQSKKGSGSEFQFTITLALVKSEVPRPTPDDQTESSSRLYTRPQ